MTLSISDRISRDKEKATQLLNRAKKLELREKQKERKAEDHRKYVLGGAILILLAEDQILAQGITDWLNRNVKVKSHRKTLGLCATVGNHHFKHKPTVSVLLDDEYFIADNDF